MLLCRLLVSVTSFVQFVCDIERKKKHSKEKKIPLCRWLLQLVSSKTIQALFTLQASIHRSMAPDVAWYRRMSLAYWDIRSSYVVIAKLSLFFIERMKMNIVPEKFLHDYLFIFLWNKNNLKRYESLSSIFIFLFSVKVLISRDVVIHCPFVNLLGTLTKIRNSDNKERGAIAYKKEKTTERLKFKLKRLHLILKWTITQGPLYGTDDLFSAYP